MIPPIEQDKHSPAPESSTVKQFRGQLLDAQSLYNIQPVLVQRFFESQASLLAEAVVQHLSQVRFSLPDRVYIVSGGSSKTVAATVPQDYRTQMAGRLMDRLSRSDLLTALHDRFLELEHADNPGVCSQRRFAASYATAVCIWFTICCLPDGQ